MESPLLSSGPWFPTTLSPHSLAPGPGVLVHAAWSRHPGSGSDGPARELAWSLKACRTPRGTEDHTKKKKRMKRSRAATSTMGQQVHAITVEQGGSRYLSLSSRLWFRSVPGRPAHATNTKIGAFQRGSSMVDLRKGAVLSTTFWGESSDGTRACMIGPTMGGHGGLSPKLIKSWPRLLLHQARSGMRFGLSSAFPLCLSRGHPVQAAFQRRL